MPSPTVSLKLEIRLRVPVDCWRLELQKGMAGPRSDRLLFNRRHGAMSGCRSDLGMTEK